MRGNYHIIFGSLAAAAVLWFTVTMGGMYQSVYSVPFHLTDLPANRALRVTLPQNISVILRGTGWQLLFIGLSKTVKYELSAEQLRSDRYLLTNLYLSDAMKLPGDVLAVQAIPETLTIAYDMYLTKRVALLPEVELQCMEGYGRVGPIRLRPDSIMITGAESILKSIRSWKTKPVLINNADADITMRVSLSDSLRSIIRLDQKEVEMYIPVRQLAEVKFSAIPITVQGIPSARQVLLSPSSVDLIVRGGLMRLSELTAAQFSASVDYSSLIKDTTNTIIPQIQLPEGVILLRLVPESIRFTIRQ